MFETLNHPWLLVEPVFPPMLTLTSDSGLPVVSITVPMRTPYETVVGAPKGVGVGVVVDPDGIDVMPVLGVCIGGEVGVTDGEGDGPPNLIMLRAKSGTTVATTIITMSTTASKPLFIPFFAGIDGGGGGGGKANLIEGIFIFSPEFSADYSSFRINIILQINLKAFGYSVDFQT
jgi:hypothetical protein